MKGREKNASFAAIARAPRIIIKALLFTHPYIDVGRGLHLLKRRSNPHSYTHAASYHTLEQCHYDRIFSSMNSTWFIEDIIHFSRDRYIKFDGTPEGRIGLFTEKHECWNSILKQLWTLPRIILSKYATVIKHCDSSSVILHEGEKHHLSLRVEGDEHDVKKNWKVHYVYDNGQKISYRSLLYIIGHQFIWTANREYWMTVLVSDERDITEGERDTREYNSVYSLIIPRGNCS